MIKLVLATLLLAAIPVRNEDIERCDILEINHFHDEQGRVVFDQLIFWVNRPDYKDCIVNGWQILKDCRTKSDEDEAKFKKEHPDEFYNPKFTPKYTLDRDFENQKYIVINEGKKIIAQTLYESWTQYDPELLNREMFPKEKRPYRRSDISSPYGLKPQDLEPKP